MSYDFSSAEPNTGSFDIIPAKTVAPVRVAVLAGAEGTPENAYAITKSGLFQLVLECTITEGPFERRKIWHRLTMGAKPDVVMSDGQKKGVSISHSFIRSLLEAKAGISATDESAAAINARKINSLMDLNGIEAWVEIGVEPASGQFEAKNKINRVVQSPVNGAPAAITQTAAALTAATAAKPVQTGKPSWAS